MGFFKNRFNKVGPGISKDEKPKRRFFLFFELYSRNIWKIITVNLLFVLCSLPIITIGPALAGLTHVLRNLSNEEQSFVASDFFDTFKDNIKQAFPAGLIMILVSLVSLIGTDYYRINLKYSKVFYALFVIAVSVDIILLFAHFYIFLMIVTLELKLKYIYKNAFLFSILGIKNNFITLIVLGVFIIISIFFIPIPVLFILYIILLPASFGFLIIFNSYPTVKKYAINPYYADSEEEHPEQKTLDIESVFLDRGMESDMLKSKNKDNKSTEL